MIKKLEFKSYKDMPIRPMTLSRLATGAPILIWSTSSYPQSLRNASRPLPQRSCGHRQHVGVLKSLDSNAVPTWLSVPVGS